MSTKLGRLLLLCDQALIDMRQLTIKVTTLEQCYVGEDQAGTADLTPTEVGLIQQVLTRVCLGGAYCSMACSPVTLNAQPVEISVTCG